MIDSLLEHSFIQAFIAAPIWQQFIAAFIGLFVFFFFIIELKMFCLRLEKKGGAYAVIAKLIFYPMALLFVIADAAMNVFYMPLLFGEPANAHGEGWLVTSRLKYHIKQPGYYWQRRVSIFICSRMVEKVDPGHCGLHRVKQ